MYNQPGKDMLLDYLRRVCPERLGGTEAFFKISLDTLSIRRGIAADQLNANINKLKELRLNYNELFVFLELNGVSLSVKASQGEYEQMRELARVLVQSIDCAGQANIAVSRQSREGYMADNFRRLIDQQPPGSRAVIWAHIDHITKEANSWMSQPLGSHLRRLYGNDYYTLGFTTNQGTFLAREARPKDAAKPMVNSYVLKPAAEASADWHLTQTGVKNFILDLRSTPKNADVSAWLSEPHPMRSRGSTFDAAFEAESFLPYKLGKLFDGLVFIETTTRARPNPSVKNVAAPFNK